MINCTDKLIKSSVSLFTPCVELLLSCLYVHIRDGGYKSDCGGKQQMNQHTILSQSKLLTMTFKNAPVENQSEKPF